MLETNFVRLIVGIFRPIYVRQSRNATNTFGLFEIKLEAQLVRS
jgi:hypothetical protein